MKNWLEEKLTILIPVLFVLQPIMDIVSYWMQQWGMSNAPTLALRFLVLAVVALTGFLLSDRKQVYLCFAGICALLAVCHGVACMLTPGGWSAPVSDLINFVRIAQMPLFAICFITFLKKGEKVFAAFETGLLLNFWVITVSVLLSAVTGTSSATYQVSGYGILGWFATSNAQSAVMSVLTPIAVLLAFRRKNLLIFVLTVAAGFAQLFFLGPRLAFLTVAVVTAGLILTMVLTRSVDWRYAVITIAAMAVCFGCYHFSPMYLNQTSHSGEMAQKQVWEEEMFARERDAALSSAEDADGEAFADGSISPEAEQKALEFIYEYYTPRLCERFGTQRVMEIYGRTRDVNTLMATRPQKILYCRLLLEELPVTSKLFGMEIASMTYGDFNFDVENDFHGIVFLLGWVGLVLMVLFLGYFAVITMVRLIKDFRGTFTVTAAAYGMVFLILLVYAYCTAGVLRRPNSSYYMSVVLAMIWALVRLKPIDSKNKSENMKKGDTL